MNTPLSGKILSTPLPIFSAPYFTIGFPKLVKNLPIGSAIKPPAKEIAALSPSIPCLLPTSPAPTSCTTLVPVAITPCATPFFIIPPPTFLATSPAPGINCITCVAPCKMSC